DFAFGSQRHHEFRQRFAVYVQVARILRHVADAKSFVQLRGRSNESGSRRQLEFAILLLVRTDDELRLQQAVTFVEKKDRENVVVDSRFDAVGDLLDDLGDFERRSHVDADFVQQCQKFTALSLAFVDPGIIDRNGDLAGQQVQQSNLVFTEITDL